MDATRLIARIVGPVLLLRAASIVIDREHFVEMVRGLDREVATISFSMVPIFILMAGIVLATVPLRSGGLPAVLIRLMGFGAIVKTSAVILFPHSVVAKAQVLTQAGFLHVVLAVCFVAGAYFTWVGYFASDAGPPA
jgi:hypothetical protein